MNFGFTLALAASSWLVPADSPVGSGAARGSGEPTPHRFTFVRCEFDSVGGDGEAYYFYDGRWWERWQTDFPEAEENFLTRLEQLSTIEVNPEPISLRLTDKDILDHPFLYMCDVGWQDLTNEETDALRVYLERGGFLWVDDFWGNAEWMNFEFNVRKAFPKLRWQTIPSEHPIFHMVFPLGECPQVPAKIFWEQYGAAYDPPTIHRYPAGGEEGVNTVNFRGLFSDDGRLMAVASHNSDIGDGWEREAESVHYFERFSTKSYAMGVNIIVYAMTH